MPSSRKKRSTQSNSKTTNVSSFCSYESSDADDLSLLESGMSIPLFEEIAAIGIAKCKLSVESAYKEFHTLSTKIIKTLQLSEASDNRAVQAVASATSDAERSMLEEKRKMTNSASTGVIVELLSRWAILSHDVAGMRSGAQKVELNPDNTAMEVENARAWIRIIDNSFQRVGSAITAYRGPKLPKESIPTIWVPETGPNALPQPVYHNESDHQRCEEFKDASLQLIDELDRMESAKNAEQDNLAPTKEARIYVGELDVYKKWKTMATNAIHNNWVSPEIVNTIQKRVKLADALVSTSCKIKAELTTRLETNVKSSGARDASFGVHAQALAELLANKPKGYDASRNEKTAQKSKDQFDMLHSAIHGDGTIPESFIEKLNCAQIDMRKSPAMASILDTIEGEMQSMTFPDEGSRMTTKLKLMHKHFELAKGCAKFKEQLVSLADQMQSDLCPQSSSDAKALCANEEDAPPESSNASPSCRHMIDIMECTTACDSEAAIFWVRDIDAERNWTNEELRGSLANVAPSCQSQLHPDSWPPKNNDVSNYYCDDTSQAEEILENGMYKANVMCQILQDIGCELTTAALKGIFSVVDIDRAEEYITNLLPCDQKTQFREQYRDYVTTIDSNLKTHASLMERPPEDCHNVEISQRVLDLAKKCLAEDDPNLYIKWLASIQKALIKKYGPTCPAARRSPWQITFRVQSDRSLWNWYSSVDLVVDADACACLATFLNRDFHKKIGVRGFTKLVNRILNRRNTRLLNTFLEDKGCKIRADTAVCTGQLQYMLCPSVAAHCLCTMQGPIYSGCYTEAMLEQWLDSMSKNQGPVAKGVAMIEFLMYKVFERDAVHILAYFFSRPILPEKVSAMGASCSMARINGPLTFTHIMTAVRHLGYTAERFVKTLWQDACKHDAVKCIRFFLGCDNKTVKFVSIGDLWPKPYLEDAKDERPSFEGGPLVWLLMTMASDSYTNSGAIQYVLRQVVWPETGALPSSMEKMSFAAELSILLEEFNLKATRVMKCEDETSKRAEKTLNEMLHTDRLHEERVAEQKKRAHEKKAINEKERKAYENWNRNTRRPLETTIMASELLVKVPTEKSFTVIQKLLRKQDNERQEADEALQRALAWARTVAIPAEKFKEADKRLADQNKRWNGKVSHWISAEVKEQRELLAQQLRPPKPAVVPTVASNATHQVKEDAALQSTTPQQKTRKQQQKTAAWHATREHCNAILRAQEERKERKEQQKTATWQTKKCNKQSDSPRFGRFWPPPPLPKTKLELPDAVDTEGIAEWENMLLDVEIPTLNGEASSSSTTSDTTSVTATKSTPTPTKADPPDELLCPISFELLTHAVMSSTGQCFQEHAINTYIDGKCDASGRQLFELPCPKTGLFMSRNVTPCYAIRTMAAAWQQDNPNYR